MKIAMPIPALLLAAAAGVAPARTPPEPAPVAAGPAARIEARTAAFAGSSANARRLVAGLRHGTGIELSGAGESVVVQPPTRPMGYGNVSRSLDLASRQLAASGITEPTPREIRAALVGGTISTADGHATLPGVLTLRSEGMGWGRIAHAIGVHPGMGPAAAPAIAKAPVLAATPATGTASIRSAAGGPVARIGAVVPGPARAAGPPAHASGAGRSAAPAAARVPETGRTHGRAPGRN